MARNSRDRGKRKRKSKLDRPRLQEVGASHAAVYGKHTASMDDRHPRFCFEFLSSKYCVTRCTGNDEKLAFLDTIRTLGAMPWKMIQLAPRKGNGFEMLPRERFTTSVGSKLEPEPEKYMVFRASDRSRLVGHREGDTFYIFAFDPKGELYPH